MGSHRFVQALGTFEGDNFVILFKDDKGTKFKGLYVLSGDGKEVRLFSPPFLVNVLF